MAYCQYEYTKRTSGEPNSLVHEIQCVWCYQNLWITLGDMPRDWCKVRPETRPYMQCKHFGEAFRKVPNKLCGECPKGVMLPVFRCDIHGQCTDRKIQVGQKMMSCQVCHASKLGFEAKEKQDANPTG